MSVGRPRDARKEQQWRRRILQWRRSDLSVQAFCTRHGLTQASFYVWRRELQHRDAKAVSFVPVEIAASESPAPASGVEILLAGKRHIRVEPGFDAVTLQRVVTTLEEAQSSVSVCPIADAIGQTDTDFDVVRMRRIGEAI